MHLTKKNSQKRQNYYRHNKRSQKRRMKVGGDDSPPVPRTPRPKHLTPFPEPIKLPTEDNVKDLISVDGNSTNYLKQTKFRMRLGEGQFGTVQKRCENVDNKKCYAVKTLIIKKEVTDEAYKKLLEDLTREVKIQKKLTMKGKKKIGNENYIAQYIAHSIKTAANSSKPIVPYLAMSLYDKSLNKLEYEYAKKIFTNNSIKNFITQLCQGLNYMNKKSISHNDLAPRNVLIAKVGEEYHPRITDFGLAMELTTNPTEIIPNKYPSLEGAPEIFTRKIYKNSDVYSAAILLSNIIFNYHYFNEKEQGYVWKDLLNQTPFNKYPNPLTIDNIKLMYENIGKGDGPLSQSYKDLIINDRYLKEDYSNNSIIATIFEDDTFRTAECFRYDVSQRSNMEELCELFNLDEKEIPALNKGVFDHLKEQLFVDRHTKVSIEPTHQTLNEVRKEVNELREAAAAKAAAKAKAEAEEEVAAEAAEAEAASSFRRKGAMRRERAEAAKAAAARARAKAEAEAERLAAEQAEAERLAAEQAEAERLEIAAEAERLKIAEEREKAEKRNAEKAAKIEKKMKNSREKAEKKATKLIKRLKKKAKKTKNLNEIKKKKGIININSLRKKNVFLIKKKSNIKNYLKFKPLRSKKKRRQLLQNIFTELPNTTRELPELPISTAGGARTNKKKSNKRSSKKSKKNYTINKKRTHKRK
jgi:serine/threonine protein kinase